MLKLKSQTTNDTASPALTVGRFACPRFSQEIRPTPTPYFQAFKLERVNFMININWLQKFTFTINHTIVGFPCFLSVFSYINGIYKDRTHII